MGSSVILSASASVIRGRRLVTAAGLVSTTRGCGSCCRPNDATRSWSTCFDLASSRLYFRETECRATDCGVCRPGLRRAWDRSRVRRGRGAIAGDPATTGSPGRVSGRREADVQGRAPAVRDLRARQPRDYDPRLDEVAQLGQAPRSWPRADPVLRPSGIQRSGDRRLASD